MELQVSRETISKWETGQSYPDFQKLVMLSDFFNMTLDQLVKDIDVQDIREKSKETLKKWIKKLCYAGFVMLGIVVLAFVLHLLFPDISVLWSVG